MAESVETRVLKVVHEIFAFDTHEDELSLSLTKDLNATSLEQMTLFIALEEEFDRSITPEEVSHVDTIKDVVGFVIEKASPQET